MWFYSVVCGTVEVCTGSNGQLENGIVNANGSHQVRVLENVRHQLLDLLRPHSIQSELEIDRKPLARQQNKWAQKTFVHLRIKLYFYLIKNQTLMLMMLDTRWHDRLQCETFFVGFVWQNKKGNTKKKLDWKNWLERSRRRSRQIKDPAICAPELCCRQ